MHSTNTVHSNNLDMHLFLSCQNLNTIGMDKRQKLNVFYFGTIIKELVLADY